MSIFGDIGSFLGLGESESVDAQQQALNELKKLKTPDIEQMKIELDQYVNSGQLAPETAQAILQQASAYNDITLDPSTRNAQMKALTSLQDIADQKGLTAEDRAILQDIASEEETRSRGAREAIMQGAQARGIAGGGLDLASQLANQQETAGRMSKRGTDVAGLAQQRALQAIQQAGQLGGSIRGQDWQQEAAKAQAADAINQFNAANKQAVAGQNVDRMNQAQLYNLQNAQNIANRNIDLKNQQQQYNKSLAQQNFENQYKRAGGIAGGYTDLSKAYGDQSKRDWETMKGIGNAGMVLFSDETKKEDISKASPLDIDEFLGNLTGYKYKYKNPEKYGEGKQVGVMAQDMEKSPIGAEAVENTPDGKAIDIKKATGLALATVASLNERLKKLEGK